jgi:hypothetical protein
MDSTSGKAEEWAVSGRGSLQLEPNSAGEPQSIALRLVAAKVQHLPSATATHGSNGPVSGSRTRRRAPNRADPRLPAP